VVGLTTCAGSPPTMAKVVRHASCRRTNSLKARRKTSASNGPFLPDRDRLVVDRAGRHELAEVPERLLVNRQRAAPLSGTTPHGGR
jgi:hypothetical protein